jgi:hypothetical protein
MRCGPDFSSNPKDKDGCLFRLTVCLRKRWRLANCTRASLNSRRRLSSRSASGLDETARGRTEGPYMPTMTREAKLKVAGHFCGRITCRIWRWFGHRLWRFERWVARGIMHRPTGRITFGR